MPIGIMAEYIHHDIHVYNMYAGVVQWLDKGWWQAGVWAGWGMAVHTGE